MTPGEVRPARTTGDRVAGPSMSADARGVLVVPWLVLALGWWTATLHADDPAATDRLLRLRGRLVQGALIVGQTRPGAIVAIDGRPVRVGEEGEFIFGLSHTAGPRADLVVTLADGRRMERRLAIEPRRYRVQRIDNLPTAMVTPPEDQLARIRAEQERLAALRDVDTPIPHFKSGFVWPARGPITGVYGSRRILNGQPRQPHWGVDIAAPSGAPVVAPADGVVLLAEPDFYYSGGIVVVDHGFGLVSSFLHLSAIDVTVGQRLRQGDRLGAVGATGRVTGPHLDWRVRWFDVFVDPQLLISPRHPPAR